MAPPSTSNSHVITGPITFAGESVRLELQMDWSEYVRRRRLGGESSCSWDALELLFDLPEGLEVPLEELPEIAADVLADAPKWAVSRTGSHVTRHYRPLATVRTVFAANLDTPWAMQIDALKWFTTVCPTMVLVVDLADALNAVDSAARAGIGIGVVDGDRWHEVLEPKVHTVHLTPSRWRLAELASVGVRG